MLTVFTKDFGRVKVLAKAVRKISSKLRPGTEIYCVSEIEFIQGKAQKTLTEAQPLKKFGNLKKDLKRLKTAYKISSAVEKFIKGQEPDENLWGLLRETFLYLDHLQFKPKNIELLYCYFIWNFLFNLGYKPRLYKCCLCEGGLSGAKLYFSFKNAGLICESCSDKDVQGKEIGADAIEAMKVFLKRKPQLISGMEISSGGMKQLVLISNKYALWALENAK